MLNYIIDRQLKIFKLHKFTPYATDEDVKAKKEATVNREIRDIQSNIATNISELQAKISQVQGKVKAVINERDTTVSYVNAAYQRFLNEIETYVHGLTVRIEQDAGKRLGDLPNQLKAYERQLASYQTLEKQQKGMHNLDQEKKVKLCNELQEQIKTHMASISFTVHPYYPFLQKLQFVPENTDLDMESLLEQAIGFLTPIKSRHEREVIINTSDMSNNMKDYAVECAHEALDKYGMYQSTEKTLENIAKSIKDRYARRYSRGDWSCFVAKAVIEYYARYDKMLSFNIDGYDIVLMECN